ncbi:MAG: glycosyltransferase family 2 protein [Planctomycetota bacterium]|nr:glycosyltransferase family 2 protein [Planctomycetota bacterium]MDW8373592.1 glycosyltransferase family 2 protein [Planctomycetota bacterium]
MAWPSGIAVLVPVFDHAQTVGAVVAGCRAGGAPLIVVVDDGSRDGSGAAAGGDVLLRLPRNRGKGAALRLGLRYLAARGWRQALSIDADLQHPPAEALRLAEAAAADPAALWIGVRDLRRAPLASRCGRWASGAACFLLSGRWPADAQSGLRVWPLPAALQWGARAARYAFEPEAVARACRCRVALRELAVRVCYPPRRISHFAPIADSWRTALALLRLLAEPPLSR